MGAACGVAFVCGSGSQKLKSQTYLIMEDQNSHVAQTQQGNENISTDSKAEQPEHNQEEGEKDRTITTNDDAYFKQDQLQLLKVKYSLERQKKAKVELKENLPVNGKIHWTEGTHLGSGSYGQVVMGMDKDSGTLMAVKKVPITSIPSKAGAIGKTEALKQEIEIYNGLSHENIVRYFGSETTKDSFNIFLEYIEGNSMADFRRKLAGHHQQVWSTS